MLLAASAFANPNTVMMYETDNDGLVDAHGGEYLAVTSNHGTFLTFCLERFVWIGLNRGYSYDVGPRAFGGNPDHHDGAAGDPLSQGTAWLYEQFIKGTLVDSDGSGLYADNHDKNAGLLQKAFWTLEDEYDFGPNPYVDLVKSIFGDAGAFSTYTGAKVQVMNLWAASGRDIQSQLIYVPGIPDTGATIVLFGLGLLGLTALRARKMTA